MAQQLEIPEEMQRRIQFLLEHQKYSRKILGIRLDNGHIVRNCFGTSAYVLGLEQIARDLWISKKHKLNDKRSPMGNYIFHKEDEFPDHIGTLPMLHLLTTLKKVDKTPGAITAYFYDNPTDKSFPGWNLRHTGVYLFTIHEKDVMFEQNGRGGSWQFVYDNVRREAIGKLASFSRETLKVEYFLPKV